jgi:hypothetical protein
MKIVIRGGLRQEGFVIELPQWAEAAARLCARVKGGR